MHYIYGHEGNILDEIILRQLGITKTISQVVVCSFIIVVGVTCACVGTYSSISGIIQNYT
jgi:hypothetical protein